jgi:dolichol-phosphate mannosyltransferase
MRGSVVPVSGTGRALVITPTYNERDNIENVVRSLFHSAPRDVDLLVIDDGSPDGTADIVKELVAADARIHLVERAGKQGLGTAYIMGFRWAIERGYEIVVEMDADLSHDPADVPTLIGALDAADLAIGSRYVPGGDVANWSFLRRTLSRAANLYARLWLGFHIKDSTSGYRAFRTSWLGDQDLAGVRSEGYVFQIDLARRAVQSGARVVEVPITFIERVAGHSKISRSIIFEALISVARWGVARMLRRAPQREGTDTR